MQSVGCAKWAKFKSLEKMNRSACGMIRSCLSQDLKYDVMIESSAKKIRETLAGKYLTKSVENRLTKGFTRLSKMPTSLRQKREIY